jgi:transcriptional regulator with XRE-family HTH domain
MQADEKKLQRRLKKVQKNITDLQKERNMHDAELERRAGMRPGSMWRWRNLRSTGGRLETLFLIADALKVKPDKLLDGC